MRPPLCACGHERADHYESRLYCDAPGEDHGYADRCVTYVPVDIVDTSAHTQLMTQIENILAPTPTTVQVGDTVRIDGEVTGQVSGVYPTHLTIGGRKFTWEQVQVLEVLV